MSIIDRLEKRFGRYAIEGVTTHLVAVQILVFGLVSIGKIALADLAFVPFLVMRGEVWRLVTFLCIPPSSHPLFIAFALYLFWLMGTALEAHWGAFRYDLYLAIAWLATVLFACITPFAPATNVFIGTSVFLAFAWVHPHFEILFMFLFPIQVRWLALATWISYALTLWLGDWTVRLGVLASVANFSVFFAGEIWAMTRALFRREAFRRELRVGAPPLRRCRICGDDETSRPDGDFRYCSKCAGRVCYCEKHLHDHDHVVEGSSSS